MMHLAYICMDKGVPVFGKKGSSIHVQEILNSFSKKCTSIKLFTNKIGGENPKGLDKIKVIELSSKSNRSSSNESLNSINQSLKEALIREGPFDFVYERYSLWSYSGMEYANSIGVPGVLEVNSPLIEEQSLYRGLVDKKQAVYVAERVFNAAKIIIAVSKGVESYLHAFSCARKKVHVVPNGVNPNRFLKIKKHSQGNSGNTFVVGFVGTLKPWHGLSVLVEAFMHLYQQVPESRLLIVGDGPEKNNTILALKEKNLLHAVEFTGAVSPSDIPSLLERMDVAVAPYPEIENFYFSPLKVFEYMIAGLPVVASRIGQLKELIQDGVNGFLVPPGDPHALSTVLYRLKQNPDLINKVGKEARSCIVSNHTWDMVLDRILVLGGITNQQKICGEIIH